MRKGEEGASSPIIARCRWRLLLPLGAAIAVTCAAHGTYLGWILSSASAVHAALYAATWSKSKSEGRCGVRTGALASGANGTLQNRSACSLLRLKVAFYEFGDLELLGGELGSLGKLDSFDALALSQIRIDHSRLAQLSRAWGFPVMLSLRCAGEEHTSLALLSRHELELPLAWSFEPLDALGPRTGGPRLLCAWTCGLRLCAAEMGRAQLEPPPPASAAAPIATPSAGEALRALGAKLAELSDQGRSLLLLLLSGALQQQLTSGMPVAVALPAASARAEASGAQLAAGQAARDGDGDGDSVCSALPRLANMSCLALPRSHKRHSPASSKAQRPESLLPAPAAQLTLMASASVALAQLAEAECGRAQAAERRGASSSARVRTLRVTASHFSSALASSRAGLQGPATTAAPALLAAAHTLSVHTLSVQVCAPESRPKASSGSAHGRSSVPASHGRYQPGSPTARPRSDPRAPARSPKALGPSSLPLNSTEASALQLAISQRWPHTRLTLASSASASGSGDPSEPPSQAEPRTGCEPIGRFPSLAVLARLLGSEATVRQCRQISGLLVGLQTLRPAARAPSRPASVGGPRLGSCAVVGGSGVLSVFPHGRLIDAHEHVFRVNACPVRGFERSVGSRTSVRFVNAPQSQKWLQALSLSSAHRLPGALTDSALALMWVERAKLGAIEQRARAAGVRTSFQQLTGAFRKACVNPIFTPDDKARHLAMTRVKGLEITFGFEALLHALYNCESVGVFGFFLDSADMAIRTNAEGARMRFPYHYWENVTYDKSAKDPYRPWTYPYHDFVLEEEKMQSMQRACLIERYVTAVPGELPR